MNLWVKYSLVVLTCYMIWTLLWEYAIKKHREQQKVFQFKKLGLFFCVESIHYLR